MGYNWQCALYIDIYYSCDLLIFEIALLVIRLSENLACHHYPCCRIWLIASNKYILTGIKMSFSAVM